MPVCHGVRNSGRIQKAKDLHLITVTHVQQIKWSVVSKRRHEQKKTNKEICFKALHRCHTWGTEMVMAGIPIGTPSSILGNWDKADWVDSEFLGQDDREQLRKRCVQLYEVHLRYYWE